MSGKRMCVECGEAYAPRKYCSDRCRRSAAKASAAKAATAKNRAKRSRRVALVVARYGPHCEICHERVSLEPRETVIFCRTPESLGGDRDDLENLALGHRECLNATFYGIYQAKRD